MPEYLIAFNDEWVPAHTPEQIEAKAAAAAAVLDQMRAAGVLVYANGAIDRSTVVSSVVAVEGAAVVSDGACVESPEHLGGFTIVDVADDDAARDWASRLAVALDWPQEVHRFPGPGQRQVTALHRVLRSHGRPDNRGPFRQRR